MNESCHTYRWCHEHMHTHSPLGLCSTTVAHMNVSYHMYKRCRVSSKSSTMSHVYIMRCDCGTHEGVTSHEYFDAMSRVNGSCYVYEWVMSHLWMSYVTYEWVIAYVWMSHGTHMNESWHTYEWVMAHIWMSHVTHMNESWHTCEWIVYHVWMSHVTRVNESCHTIEWVMSHIWMSRFTNMNGSCHSCACGMSRMQLSHVNDSSLSVNDMKPYCSYAWYGAAMISRRHKNIGLFCKRALCNWVMSTTCRPGVLMCGVGWLWLVGYIKT